MTFITTRQMLYIHPHIKKTMDEIKTDSLYYEIDNKYIYLEITRIFSSFPYGVYSKFNFIDIHSIHIDNIKFNIKFYAGDNILYNINSIDSTVYMNFNMPIPIQSFYFTDKSLYLKFKLKKTKRLINIQNINIQYKYTYYSMDCLPYSCVRTCIYKDKKLNILKWYYWDMKRY